MAKIYTDTKEKSSRIVAPDILIGDEEQQEKWVSNSEIIARHVASCGGVNSGKLGKGGDHKGKRVTNSIHIASCGATFTSGSTSHSLLRAKLHKKVCPVCSLTPKTGMKMTNMKADATGNNQMTLDVSGSYIQKY
jgi:hypothetical protein